jgi:hypothetical protein
LPERESAALEPNALETNSERVSRLGRRNCFAGTDLLERVAEFLAKTTHYLGRRIPEKALRFYVVIEPLKTSSHSLADLGSRNKPPCLDILDNIWPKNRFYARFYFGGRIF